MANIQNQYNYTLKERKKIKEELNQLKNEKFVKRYLLLQEKDRLLKQKENVLSNELLYHRFCSCKHILVYTEYEHDYFYKNTNRTFACVKCGLNSAVLKSHKDFLTDENQVMYKYLVEHPFLETSIELKTSCNFNLAKKVFEKVREKYPNIKNEMLKKYFYVALKYNLDNIKIKKMNK